MITVTPGSTTVFPFGVQVTCPNCGEVFQLDSANDWQWGRDNNGLTIVQAICPNDRFLIEVQSP